MIVALLGTHIFLTIRLRCPQRHIFRAIRLSLTADRGSSGDVSQFGALATSLAATIGTGNIIGVAMAVALGGPGAVLWCWLTGVLGIATKYAEGLLAVKFRVRTARGEMLGGPMYALDRGLGMRRMAVAFSLFTALAAFGIGGTVQANSIALLAQETLSVPPWLSGAVVTALVAAVVFFGIKGIARVCTALVPFMALFYIVGCLAILWMNAHVLGETLRLIVTSAFTPLAAGGGFVGSTVMMAARHGIARGLFSNESGLGSAPIVAAAARTRNPVRQALVSSTGTFWDTVVICALTGLVLVSSIVAYPDISSDAGGALTKAAFAKIPFAGSLVLTVAIFTFAFSTMLGWSYYAGKAVEYLGGQRWMKVYLVVWTASLFVGSVAQLRAVWDFADIVNALMALPNLLSLVLLSGVLVSESRRYLWTPGHLDDLGE